MCMVSNSNETEIEKVKVLDLEVIARGILDKPYYEIKYYDLSDHQYHVGYGSYSLDTVLRYKEEYFEIVSDKERQDSISHYIEVLRDLSEFQISPHHKRMLLRVANAIEELYVRSLEKV